VNTHRREATHPTRVRSQCSHSCWFVASAAGGTRKHSVSYPDLLAGTAEPPAPGYRSGCTLDHLEARWNHSVGNPGRAAHNRSRQLCARQRPGRPRGARGAKFVRTDGLVVRANSIHNNNGPGGLWSDGYNTNSLIELKRLLKLTARQTIDRGLAQSSRIAPAGDQPVIGFRFVDDHRSEYRGLQICAVSLACRGRVSIRGSLAARRCERSKTITASEATR
jgi:hypothetical protein